MIRKFSISNLLDEQAKINDPSSHGKRLSHSSEQTASSQPETQSNTVSSQAEAESRDSPDGVAFNFQPLNQPRPCNKPWFADRTYRRHSAGEVIVKKAARRRSDRGYSLTDTLLRDTLVQDGYVSLPRQLSKPLLQIIDPPTYENIYSAPSMDSLDEGLSMSEEDDHILLPDHQGYSGAGRQIEELSTDQKLVVAAQRGISDLVRELLHQGAQLCIDQNGTTAFHQAAQGGFADVVRILLDTGAEIDSPDSGGYTALHKAAGKGHLDVLGLLINEGCDIDTQDETYGNTPLHEAAWNGYSKSVDLLLKNKSNAFIANRAGCTALHLAAQSGHNQSGRALLYAGCSPDVKNNYGDTPLHTAARYGHAGIARILISARCSVSEQNKNGDTSLHIAAAFKRRKIAKLLVEGGMNTQLANKQTETATDIARRKEHMSIIEIIHLGMAEPTGGVKLDHHHHNNSARDSVSSNKGNSSQVTGDSRETTPDTNNRAEHRKKSTGLVSWIRKKFAKEKNEKDGLHSRSAGHKHLELDDGNLGLFSQYVKRQGFAYYRDLAGNIRQGPVGYVPNCHCDSNKPALDPLLNKSAKFDPRNPHITHNGQLLHEVDVHTNRRLEEAAADLAAQEKLMNERQEDLDRLRMHNIQDRVGGGKTDQTDAKVRGDLQSWLATQMSDSKESSIDPFGYSVGTKQQRFGDDFDHQRIARYEAMLSEQFPPPPRLFRSRSDETLTHSEYSFHGRAFKSREAAMEELKTLKHHEEIRERRKLIRAGLHDAQLSTNRLSKKQPMSQVHSSHQTKPTYSHHQNSASKEETTHKALWKSHDNLADDNPRAETAGESHQIPLRRTSSKANPPDHHRQAPNTSSLKRAESAHVSMNGRSDRVIGRREQSKSPDRKPDIKSPAVQMPLKSALRQPRATENVQGKLDSGPRLYRSNSLPRDSKAEFGAINVFAEPRKTVKTVRYDENVKSAEIAQDLPPNISPAQVDEVILPAKREAPIGGHDENFSETAPPPAFAYPTSHTSPIKPNNQVLAHQRDLRESIVSTRNELLARNKYEPNNASSRTAAPNNIHRAVNVNTNRTDSGDEPQPIPFTHYSNGYGRQTSQPNSHAKSSSYGLGNNFSYSTSSLPRQQRNSDSAVIGYNGGSTKQQPPKYRAPLPSYDEVQSTRNKPNTDKRVPSHYPMKNNGHLNQLPQHRPKSPNQPPQNHHKSPHQLPQNQQKTSHQLPPNHHNSGSPLLYSRPVHEHLHQDSPLSADTTNTGSCSSSNPDSGYGGNFYDSGKPSPEYHSWYQQNLQSTALKMSGQHAKPPPPVHEHSKLKHQQIYGSASQRQPLTTDNSSPSHLMNGGPPRTPSRTVYTNMISDV